MPFERDTRGVLSAAALVVALACTAHAAVAASPADRASARQHLKQAEEAKKKGQLAEACGHLEEVERLDPKLRTLIELADCTEQLGKLVEAQALWASARDRAKHDEKPQSRAKAEGRLAAVTKRIAHLTLSGAPAGAQVLCDDVVLEPAALSAAIPLSPGEHVVVVRLAGHDDAKLTLKLADGDSQSLPIAAGPLRGSAPAAAPASAASAPTVPASPAPAATQAAAAPPADAAAPAPEPAPAAPASWWSTEHEAGVILGAAGVVAIGGGSALLVLANKDAKEQDTLVDNRLSLGAVSLVAGGVMLISGVVLMAGSSKTSPEQASLPLTPTLLVARGGAVLGATGAF